MSRSVNTELQMFHSWWCVPVVTDSLGDQMWVSQMMNSQQIWHNKRTWEANMTYECLDWSHPFDMALWENNRKRMTANLRFVVSSTSTGLKPKWHIHTDVFARQVCNGGQHLFCCKAVYCVKLPVGHSPFRATILTRAILEVGAFFNGAVAKWAIWQLLWVCFMVVLSAVKGCWFVITVSAAHKLCLQHCCSCALNLYILYIVFVAVVGSFRI